MATDGIGSDTRDRLVARLDEAPVSLAVLFGSHATGDVTARSDVDIAVAYEDDVDATDAHISLVADLTQILGTDDVDVVRLPVVDPRIAVDALDHGDLLVGSPEDVETLRSRLEADRKQRADEVQSRISAAEQAIERRLDQREHG
jgi:predicted nucleotidyltransferase